MKNSKFDLKTAISFATIVVATIGYFVQLKSNIAILQQEVQEQKDKTNELYKLISEKYNKIDNKRTELKNDIEQDMSKLQENIKSIFDEYKIRNNQKVDELIREISKTITKVEVNRKSLEYQQKQIDILRKSKH